MTAPAGLREELALERVAADELARDRRAAWVAGRYADARELGLAYDDARARVAALELELEDAAENPS